MAEPMLQPRSVLADLPAGVTSRHGLTIIDRDGLRLATVLARSGQEAALRVCLRDRHGLDLPHGPRRSQAGSIAAIGTGPGAWLVVAETAGDFAATLSAAFDGLAAVADQSDGLAVLRLQDPALREVLSKGIALDLHPSAFGPGMAAVTMVGHVGLTLWRVDDGTGALAIEVAVPRSFFGSFWSWLDGSAASAETSPTGARPLS